MLNKIAELAKTNKKISDFHLRSGSDISYRALGDIVMEPNSQVEDKDLQDLLKNNCSEDEIKKFEVKNELDTAVMLGELRFRANFYKTLNGLAAVLRRVETKIPLMEDLNLPQILFSLLDAHKGLVLVTGPTGSGKSTTLAAIINQINESRPSNIITIEDPVEFIHKVKLEIVISNKNLDLLINIISDIARSGKKGDGKIFVTNIEKVVRIRTGETDHDAL